MALHPTAAAFGFSGFSISAGAGAGELFRYADLQCPLFAECGFFLHFVREDGIQYA